MSLYTVSRELGHSSLAMVERTYAHLGEVRHRSEIVEFASGSTSRHSAIGSKSWVFGHRYWHHRAQAAEG